MATRRVAAFNDETVVVDAVYDDEDNVTGVRVTNTSADDVYVEAVQVTDGPSNGRKHGGRFLASTTTTLPIGTGPVVRIRQHWNAQRERWDGVEFRCLVPAP
jgi:hypothetical protein